MRQVLMLEAIRDFNVEQDRAYTECAFPGMKILAVVDTRPSYRFSFMAGIASEKERLQSKFLMLENPMTVAYRDPYRPRLSSVAIEQQLDTMMRIIEESSQNEILKEKLDDLYRLFHLVAR